MPIKPQKKHVLYLDEKWKNPLFFTLSVVLIVAALGYQHHVNAKKQATRCSQFATQTLAQQYYHDKGKGYYELYTNSQGQVCTRLPKG